MPSSRLHDTRRFTPPRRSLRPVTAEIPADCDTPVSAFLKLRPAGAVFLLESVEQGENLGRYSFIGLAPHCRIELGDGEITIHRDGRTTRDPHRGDPIGALKHVLAGYSLPAMSELPSLCGGAVGYLGYDLVRSLERVPDTARRDLGLPLGILHLTSTLVVFDHVKRTLRVIAIGGPEADPARQVESVVAALSRPLLPPSPPPERPVSAPPRSNFTADRFRRAVEGAKEYIRKGDIFQVVLSQRLTGETAAEPFQVYRALRMINPSPYMVYFDFGGFQMVASSPEALVKLTQGVATVRPIAGTRPRGADPAADRAHEKALLEDAKERAEHVMLVDLGRNDLGRVCEYGSVRTTEFMTVERYSHVMHLVSNVEGRLAGGRDMFDLLRATFPAGTVSGAPKVRAMEIIEELEGIRREHYAGVMGYFGFAGDMDMCITIRTILLQGGRYVVQGGAGIVADSDPQREYEETVHKTEALLAAIRMAESGRGLVVR
ncbi:MAG: anthranilate synthase component I [Planctomycetes bacterium]|nr:anthranilate synthase component I [Planctomycetota bacterium]